MLVFNLITMVLIIVMIHFIGSLFQQKKLKKVFVNNYSLFIMAIIIFIIGAIVETIVLNHVSILEKIYMMSYSFV